MGDFHYNKNSSSSAGDRHHNALESTERNSHESLTSTENHQQVSTVFEVQDRMTSYAMVVAEVPQDNCLTSRFSDSCADDTATSALDSCNNSNTSPSTAEQRNCLTVASNFELDRKGCSKTVDYQNNNSEALIGVQITKSSYSNNEMTDQSRALPIRVGTGELGTSSVMKSLGPEFPKILDKDHSMHKAKSNDEEASSSAKCKMNYNSENNTSSKTVLWKSNDSLPSASFKGPDEDFLPHQTPFRYKWCLRMLSGLGHVFSPRQALQELRNPLFWHDVIVETVLCMYYECLIIFISVTFNSSIYQPSITHFGLYAGFFVFTCIEGWGPMCGASVNPARTWSVFLAGRMTFIKALIYTIVEVGGAAAGTMIGYGLTPSNATGQIIPLLPGTGVSAVRGMAIEAVLTFNLIFVGLVLGQPSGQPSPVASLTIGFCVGTGVLAAGTHTGGLQNPIVAFGPAIISGNFQDHWLYWVGPYVGSTVATVFYLLLKFMRETYQPKNQSESEVNRERHEMSTEL